MKLFNEIKSLLERKRLAPNLKGIGRFLGSKNWNFFLRGNVLKHSLYHIVKKFSMYHPPQPPPTPYKEPYPAPNPSASCLRCSILYIYIVHSAIVYIYIYNIYIYIYNIYNIHIYIYIYIYYIYNIYIYNILDI